MKPTTDRTVTPAQREADKLQLKTPEGQAAMDALRAKMSADLRERAAKQPVALPTTLDE